ncbi:MAG: helix-turn-helix domain-containing protein [Janthinobacterium lividum]
MPRRARPSLQLLARVRAWFGLRQDELALFLQVSPALVQRLESGQRTLTTAVAQALLPLLPHLPPEGQLLPDPDHDSVLPALPLAALPELAALDFQRRQCQQRAARLHAQAAALARQAHTAGRWAQALPALLAAVPAASSLAPTAEDDRAAWLRGWLGRRARPLPTEEATRYYLLRARATALDAEAVALAEFLAACQPLPATDPPGPDAHGRDV